MKGKNSDKDFYVKLKIKMDMLDEGSRPESPLGNKDKDRNF